MKATIHPQYYEKAQVICACGNRFTVGSTREIIHVQLCNRCHPFFTGTQKFVDTVGRIERFKQKQEKAKPLQGRRREKEEAEEKRPRTLREMLAQATSPK